MPKFSPKSLNKLRTCHSDLVLILSKAIRHFDFTVLEGHRTEERQNRLYDEGRSQVRYPDSKHNAYPSLAVDIAPYPIDWNDRERFTYLAGLVMGIAASEGIKLRWGGDWDRDTELDDNKFDDLPHFELVSGGSIHDL